MNAFDDIIIGFGKGGKTLAKTDNNNVKCIHIHIVLIGSKFTC